MCSKMQIKSVYSVPVLCLVCLQYIKGYKYCGMFGTIIYFHACSKFMENIFSPLLASLIY